MEAIKYQPRSNYYLNESSLIELSVSLNPKKINTSSKETIKLVVNSLYEHYLKINSQQTLSLIDFQFTVVEFITEVIGLSDSSVITKKCTLNLTNAHHCNNLEKSLNKDHLLVDRLIDLIPNRYLCSCLNKWLLGDDLEFIVKKLVVIFHSAQEQPLSNLFSPNVQALIDNPKKK